MKITPKKLKQNFPALKKIFIHWPITNVNIFGLSSLIQREKIFIFWPK